MAAAAGKPPLHHLLPKNMLTSPFTGELLARRSVYVKVRPAPRSLTQRRAVLGVLRRHGRVEVFRGLGEPHSFISVTADSATAQNLILKAPLELSYGKGEGGEGEGQGEKFLVDIFEASRYNHKRFASHLSLLAGPWGEGDVTGYPGDLRTTAPVPGLADHHDGKGEGEVHEGEGLVKSGMRRFLEGGYRDGWVDNGWRGMTDWEGGGQGVEYKEDGETFEGGWRAGVLRGRWKGRGKGGLVIGEDKGDKGEGGKGGKVRIRRVVTGGEEQVLGEGEVTMKDGGSGGKVGEERRWRVKERTGLIMVEKRWT
ncbi:hypothetical protein QBC41DRAFT_373600 [Cercophora samala]|uniref:Uncharacterized protein n=1 Tax=Cercophora samala TaxID=330535 RepID=A0AA40DAB6_9PEZI|nr:hypothetical protein QBC41DRAFT_373600 [Cercophora samala]